VVTSEGESLTEFRFFSRRISAPAISPALQL
jgi:hypothetical protein